MATNKTETAGYMNATADQKTILLAASESSERQAAVDPLVAVNCYVVTATGLSQTSARRSSRTFDFVLLDLDLPNHAGRRIAQYLSHAHNYLLVIAVNPRPNERIQTSMLDVDAVLNGAIWNNTLRSGTARPSHSVRKGAARPNRGRYSGAETRPQPQ